MGLSSRFDSAALRPPEPVPPVVAAALPAARRVALRAWCLRQSGPGGAPLLQPFTLPTVERRLSVAALSDADGPAVRALANLVASDVDGGLRLAAMSRMAGLLWRWQVKWADTCWWRPREADDPWDAGWAQPEPAAAAHLGSAFVPRRATLVLADAAHARLLSRALGQLAQRAIDFPHPVRWLWVGLPDQLAPFLVDERFEPPAPRT